MFWALCLWREHHDCCLLAETLQSFLEKAHSVGKDHLDLLPGDVTAAQE